MRSRLKLLIVLLVFLTVPLLVGQMEHKAMAHMQGRLGPMYAGGFHGWAQLVADGVKFAQKESVVPKAADRRVFELAPFVALLPVPRRARRRSRSGPGARVGERPRHRACSSRWRVVSVGIIGIADGRLVERQQVRPDRRRARRGTADGVRAAAGARRRQSPRWRPEPFPCRASSSSWNWWWLPWQGVAAVVFFVAGLAELRRPPFDMPYADSEIIFGPLTEYTGLRFALFLLAEYAGIVVLAALTAVLFLGGWRGPFLEHQLGWLWTLVKVIGAVVPGGLAAGGLPAAARGPAAEAGLDGARPAGPRSRSR